MTVPAYPNPVSLREVSSEFAFNIISSTVFSTDLGLVSGNTWTIRTQSSVGQGDLTGKYLKFQPSYSTANADSTVHTYKITSWFYTSGSFYVPGYDTVQFEVDDGWTPTGAARVGQLNSSYTSLASFYRTGSNPVVPPGQVGYPKGLYGVFSQLFPASGAISLNDLRGATAESFVGFTGSQTWTVPFTGTYYYLMAGGGGGGGTSVYSNYLEGGGGGGAGGVIWGTVNLTKGEVITVIIGGGGGNTSYRTQYDYYGNPYTVLTNGGSNGGDTTITSSQGTLRAYGGGGGGGYNGQDGLGGGSGGGRMSAYGQGTAGSGVSGQGYNGGAGLEDHYSGGGGGRAVAGSWDGGGSVKVVFDAQNPYSSNLTYFLGPGGGGGYYLGRAYPGSGGEGGWQAENSRYPGGYPYGRAAAFYVDDGKSGQPNTGGGGGGGAYYGGGQGGSGYALLYWAPTLIDPSRTYYNVMSN